MSRHNGNQEHYRQSSTPRIGGVILKSKLFSALTASLAAALVIFVPWQLRARTPISATDPAPADPRLAEAASVPTSASDRLVVTRPQQTIAPCLSAAGRKRLAAARGKMVFEGKVKDVVAHYASVFNLTLSGREQDDLIDYLKSL